MRTARFGALTLAIVLSGGISAALAAERPIWTKLSGDKGASPGDQDGRGEALVSIDSDRSEICLTLTVSGIAAPSAVRILEGEKGNTGPVLTALTMATNGARTCTSVGASVIERILKNPAGFYLNVENSEFPSGALRGQLDE